MAWWRGSRKSQHFNRLLPSTALLRAEGPRLPRRAGARTARAIGHRRPLRHAGFWDCIKTVQGIRSCSLLLGGRQLGPKTAFVTRTGTTSLTLSEEIRLRRVQPLAVRHIVDHCRGGGLCHTAEELPPGEHLQLHRGALRAGPGIRGLPRTAARDEKSGARVRRTATAEPHDAAPVPIDQTEFETARHRLREDARKVDRDEVTAAVDLISRGKRMVPAARMWPLSRVPAAAAARPAARWWHRLPGNRQARPGGRQDRDGALGRPLVVRAIEAATIAIQRPTLSEVGPKFADHKLYYSSDGPSALLGLIRLRGLRARQVGLRGRIKAFRLK